MSTIFIIDIDGTVCDSTPRVKKMYERLGINEDTDNLDAVWSDETMKEFLKEESIMEDNVISGAEKVLDISTRCNAIPIFLTGRNEYARKATRKWLSTKLGVPDNILLLMRPLDMKDDNTADCKEQMFINNVYNLYGHKSTYIFFEDHKKTIEKYSRFGLVLKSPECWKGIG